MTADALLVVKTLFDVIWRLFTSWKIPGTNTTPAAWFLFVAMAVLALRVMKTLISGLNPAPGYPQAPPLMDKTPSLTSGRSLSVRK